MIYASLDEIIDSTGEDTKVLTNADRIRAMSDEELAAWFERRDLCAYIQDTGDWCESRGSCSGCISDWLRQPVKDGGRE